MHCAVCDARPPAQGIQGHGFYGNCVVPIIENTARECELTDRLRQAIIQYPQANAVLVRRHGALGAALCCAALCCSCGITSSLCCVLMSCTTSSRCRVIWHKGKHMPSFLTGVYVWGHDWISAKTQAECYDYLFEAAVRMAQLGIDASRPPPPLLLGDAAANGTSNGKRAAENGVHVHGAPRRFTHSVARGGGGGGGGGGSVGAHSAALVYRTKYQHLQMLL